MDLFIQYRLSEADDRLKDIKEEKVDNRTLIEQGKAILGIEFGSTRIKAVVIDEKGNTLASGGHGWENRLENGIWTYTLDDIWSGLRDCYADMLKDVKEKYDTTVTSFASIGFSAMMHGYLAFDKAGELLVPFRTWRNTITEQASEELTKAFDYNIPQRWSISHLYQAILNGEEHVPDIDYFTTLAGYVHWKLTGQKVIGIDSVSGLPREESISAEIVNEGIEESVGALASEMKTFLERIPPQTAVNITKEGIYLTGGSVHLPCIHQFLADSTGFSFNLPDAYEKAAIGGLEKIIQNKELRKWAAPINERKF